MREARYKSIHGPVNIQEMFSFCYLEKKKNLCNKSKYFGSLRNFAILRDNKNCTPDF